MSVVNHVNMRVSQVLYNVFKHIILAQKSNLLLHHDKVDLHVNGLVSSEFVNLHVYEILYILK